MFRVFNGLGLFKVGPGLLCIAPMALPTLHSVRLPSHAIKMLSLVRPPSVIVLWTVTSTPVGMVMEIAVPSVPVDVVFTFRPF